MNFLKNPFYFGSMIYFLSNIGASIIPFLLLPILTRYLSIAEYGQVAMFQTLLIALSSFIGISAQGAASVRYYDSDKSHDYASYVGSCFLILLITILVTLAIVSIFIDPLTRWLGILPWWIFSGILISGFSFIVLMRMTQWQIRNQAKKYGLFQVSQAVINGFLTLIFVVAWLKAGDGRILAIFLTALIYAAISVYLLYRDNLIKFIWQPKYLLAICAFGIPLIPHSIGYALLSAADRFYINNKFGLIDVGIYMAAVQIASVFGLLFDGINNAFVPWLFERLKKNISSEKKEIVRWTYFYFLTLLGIVFLAFSIGPFFLEFIAGLQYGAAGELVGWLVLGQVFQGMYLMVTNYIFFSKRTGLLSLSTVGSGLVNILLLLLLTSYIGLKGAAIAFAIAMGMKFIFTWYIASKRHPMPWFNFN
ncbi:oligosaccharide flippase family protein [Polynucleobacter paneuropaeus]|nr:oligosaccharide flippase family protein [Polynucleobacter paneuropaeus]MBT8533704.1 oligosaccharide flippase family protein [Polynucleobacter paneuropaeus]